MSKSRLKVVAAVSVRLINSRSPEQSGDRFTFHFEREDMTDDIAIDKKITLGVIVSWGLGTLCALAAIVCVSRPDMFVAGLLYLLLAVLLLPIVRQYVHKKTNLSLSGGVRFVISFVLLIVAATLQYEPSADSSLQPAVSSAISTSNPPAAVASKKGLIVEHFELQMSGHGYGKIIGTLTNATNKQFSYAQVEFNLYDETGAQVGSTLANINNLEAGGRWNFEAGVLEARAVEAKLKGITSF